MSLHSRRRLYEFQRRAEEKGRPLPAAITIGTHPHQAHEEPEASVEKLVELARHPRCIGIVTSPVGAVWRDIGNVLRRRYPRGGPGQVQEIPPITLPRWRPMLGQSRAARHHR